MARSALQRRLKRLVAMSENDIDRALVNVKELHDAFDGVHPSEVEAIETIAQGLVMAQQLLRDFWGVCWGTPPDDLSSYR